MSKKGRTAWQSSSFLCSLTRNKRRITLAIQLIFERIGAGFISKGTYLHAVQGGVVGILDVEIFQNALGISQSQRLLFVYGVKRECIITVHEKTLQDDSGAGELTQEAEIIRSGAIFLGFDASATLTDGLNLFLNRSGNRFGFGCFQFNSVHR